MPLEPFDTPLDCETNACGRLLTRSSTRVVPWSLNSSLVTVVIGLALCRFGVAMREPVTTISPPDEVSSCEVEAGACASTGPSLAAVG